MTTSILVHGGAGTFASDADADAAAQGCRLAARLGYSVLAAGGGAVEAVVAAVGALEDNPRFNAGVGSVLNVDGEVEMDASLMDGQGGRAGAVALVRRVKNPVRLAQLVMTRSPHVLLAGEGAEAFAREQGVPAVDPTSLITPGARLAWQRGSASKHGTVGAVAWDGAHVAAATSTGGTAFKRRGRIGDSPLIGCGTYARDGAGAASCTGLGEAIMRAVLAKSAVDLVAGGTHPAGAARQALPLLGQMGGAGGMILIDAAGRLGVAFDTPRMSHAWIDVHGRDGAETAPDGPLTLTA